MDRRKSIKALIVGTVSTGVIVEACQPGEKKAPEQPAADNAGPAININRMKEELEHEKEVVAKTFFTPGEMATITLLSDIIIPKDELSGSASDAGVPAFIEFIVKEKPEHQTPMRGGLRWLDLQCLNRYGKAFKDASQPQQIEMVDAIAYPKKAKPEMAQGVAFFSLMRNLTASGFYTSEIGVKDIGYMGNVPNQWNGVPEDVLKQHGLAYTEKELKECYDPGKT
ncbi:MAG TPA: gluconate 2-dehydrogenase subunit 3 family protein [Puia sp.]|jgi:gluconate 2-dehydrogenase gamma chain|nr:gluconate 2-dehydrogenase subunit 3 family protein [Puia sp.]